MSLHVVIAGASGFLGTHLTERLRARGHEVTHLVRHPTQEPGEASWDPYGDVYPPALIEAADVVVNLAGAPLIGNPHSQKWADAVLESRVTTTRLLASAIARSDRKPAFMAGSGVSIYGDHGDTVLTEASDSRGHALLTEVARQWEAATQPAEDAGARVVRLRTSPVMDRRSAPLAQLRLLFSLGLGARLGSGEQHMAMISLRDWVDAVVHLAEHEQASGPVNLVSAVTPTNAEFTRALAHALHRPAVVFAPAPVMKVAAGRLAPELLGSLNLRPAALEALGFTHRDPDVAAVLAAGLAAAD
ncbi:TIGR01777 family oxidoreductase [Nocardioides bruguierae]|uniref:TIGR01777 family oxidoreductase n=1 Tax=Nocardioides bruguierae TaxID=2945102 RepID=A0A9X2IDZ4_9ACTN|nr:TIGR01777 family oxidoreductase [Nocardioides bruguierae]MCM0619538.1 TIGR01777 family oxidoreductase [Nocardioides bruguierae]